MSWSETEGSRLKKAAGGAGVGVRSCGGRSCRATPSCVNNAIQLLVTGIALRALCSLIEILNAQDDTWQTHHKLHKAIWAMSAESAPIPESKQLQTNLRNHKLNANSNGWIAVSYNCQTLQKTGYCTKSSRQDRPRNDKHVSW